MFVKIINALVSYKIVTQSCQCLLKCNYFKKHLLNLGFLLIETNHCIMFLIHFFDQILENLTKLYT